MRYRQLSVILTLILAGGALCASLIGIITSGSPDPFVHENILGEPITIYGSGVYRHMSSAVAIQGIAQDWVTAFAAVPILLLSLIGVLKQSLRAQLIHSGTSAYLFVTYWFYLAMAAYNELFLLYALLAGIAFFSLFTSIQRLFDYDYSRHTGARFPHLFAGTFLMINAMLIGLLWLSSVLPPLLDGTIFPAGLEHYTTLIVQGFDLGLLLPMAFVSGYLMRKNDRRGIIFGSVYIIFLALLMSALVAKIIAMGLSGDPIIPVIFIIPSILGVDLYLVVRMMRTLPRRVQNQ
jgi:hypothetical protein